MLKLFRCLCSQQDDVKSDIQKQKEPWFINLIERLKDESTISQWPHYFLANNVLDEVENNDSHEEYQQKLKNVKNSYLKSKSKMNTILEDCIDQRKSENLSTEIIQTHDSSKQYSKLKDCSFFYQDILQEISNIRSQKLSKEIIRANFSECVYFIKLMETIKENIYQKNHQIYPLIQQFFSFIYKISEWNNYKLIQSEILTFTQTLSVTVLDYYELKEDFGIKEDYEEITDLENNENKFLAQNNEPPQNTFLKKENVDAYFYNLILSEKQLQDIVFEQIRALYDDESQIISTVIKNFLYDSKEISLMNRFQVNPKYRLDKQTLRMLQKDEEKNYNLKRPYSSAYTKLRRISSKSILSNKIKVIIKTQMKIMECIAEFYREVGVEFTDQLGGDDLLGIYLYIIVMANVEDLNIHLRFCLDYLTYYQMNSLTGYYLINIMASCQYLISLSKFKEKQMSVQDEGDQSISYH